MNRTLSMTLLVLGGVLLVVSLSVFTVSERERAILFRLGQIVKADYEPGIHFKIPIIHTVQKYDARIQTLDAASVQYQTIELKNVVVDAFVKWRIEDVSDYFVAVGSGDINSRLGQIINDLSRDQFGKRTVQEVVSGDRSEIMRILQERANEVAGDFGVEIVDVRIKRVDLPANVSSSVYGRMEAERTRVAKELRSQGGEEAEKIRAEADKERTIALARAYREAQALRGEGDAIATDIYAQAFGQDAEFYSFYRSLQAYREVLDSGDDLVVIQPDNEFFQYFGRIDGR
ncbi:MAG: protease modulator HflC [Pseudomonadota bacterium]|nr:protease modulator HflC [Pseudomonadota bacterium]